MISRRGLLAGAVISPLLAGVAPAFGQVATATIDEIIQTPQVVDVAISPNGEHIVLLRQIVEEDGRRAGGEVRRAVVTFRDANTLEDISHGNLGRLITERVHWLDNDNVLITMLSVGFGVQRRLAVMNRHNLEARYLLQHRTDVADHGRIVDYLPDDPDHIMIALRVQNTGIQSLHKLNVHTDEEEMVERGSEYTAEWITQGDQAIMRTDISPSGRTALLYGRAPGEIEWKVVRRYHNSTLYRPDFDVIAPVKNEPGKLYVAAAAEGENYRSLRTFDVASMEWGEKISGLRSDVAGLIRDYRGNLIATTYISDRREYDCVDTGLTAELAELGRAFSVHDMRVRDLSEDLNKFIMNLSSANNAGAFILYDRTVGAVGLIGDSRPWLTQDKLPTMDALDVRSRDGTLLRAYLTIPVGGGAKPLVVMPHGGPESRDQIQFDMYAQVLAAQGWYVLQPNFRGSGGYGKAFADAGRRQWNGLLMEDIEASIDYALENYPIDRDRIAIFGGSFGGYAALMQAVRQPTLYKAVVGYCGVYDLPRMMEREYDAEPEHENSVPYQYWARTLGDPETEMERLRRDSPVFRAEEIQAPVLLQHGTSDETVHIEQTRRMESALGRAGKQVRKREYFRMGHGVGSKDEAEDFFADLVGFLREHLA